MSEASEREQSSAGLNRLTPEERDSLLAMNSERHLHTAREMTALFTQSMASR